MQLEELQQNWKLLDEKLEQVLKLNSQALRLAVIQPARRRISRLLIWPTLDIAFFLAMLLFAGGFAADHWGTWPLVVPAVVVMLAAVLVLIGSIRQLKFIAEIDWSGTLVEIQSSIARLRIAKIQQFKWVILLSPLVGFCGLMIGIQGLLDRLPEPHSIFDKINSWWIACNLVFGVLFIPFGQALIAVFSKRFGVHGWWQRTLDDISGKTIQETQQELQRWTNLDC